jgi:hypothetical protein
MLWTCRVSDRLLMMMKLRVSDFIYTENFCEATDQ